EFELKKHPSLVTSDGRGHAKVDWPRFDVAVQQLSQDAFLDKISAETKNKILSGPRNRPMVQFVDMEAGERRAIFRPVLLPENDAAALVVATRRVRNNLFHGGKQDPLEEQYIGDDQEWTAAACEVAKQLLTLVRAQCFAHL